MPSDNKYNPRPRRKGVDYLNYKDQIVKSALAKSKFRPRPQTQAEALIQKDQDIVEALKRHIQPIIQAGGALDPSGLISLRETVMTMLTQAYDTALSKDEIVNLCAMVHTDIIMESIEADPYGKGKPDLLSGV